MKKKSLVFALWLMSSAAMLANGEARMIVTLRSGATAGFLLNERPVVTFSSEEVLLTTNNEIVMYDRSEVKDITFDGHSSSGIEQVPSANERAAMPTFTLSGSALSIKGLPSGSLVNVYGTDGRLCTSVTADQEGSASLSLPASSARTFIVKTSITTFKIVKK